jgi:hypothetical protein
MQMVNITGYLQEFDNCQHPVLMVQQIFWLAAQGGYGIMMAPMLAKAATAILLNQDLPDDLNQQGMAAGDMCVSRLLSRPHS